MKIAKFEDILAWQKSQILENYRNNNLNYNDIPKKYK